MHRGKYPIPKPVMVIVDYPIQNEVERDMAWAGASHLSLLSDLAKAGISQRDIHRTYLSYSRPDKDSFDWSTDFKKRKSLPENEQNWFALTHQKDLFVSEALWEEFQGLLEEIRTVQPKVIIVAGKWSLFFLSGEVSYSATQGSGKSQKPLGGLAKYRASIESVHESLNLPEVIMFPMLPPVTKQRSPDKIPVLRWDCLKVGDIYTKLCEGKPVSDFLDIKQEHILGTEFEVVSIWLQTLLNKLNEGKVLLSVDIETKFSAIIDCIGLAYEKNSGICIPFATSVASSYWSFEEEVYIMFLIRKVLEHENTLVIAQNGAYDAAFIYKFWLTNLNLHTDTMILHHVLYNTMEKNLAFLASVYCENYKYWKDDQQHG